MAVAIATKVDPNFAGYGAGENYTITFPSGLQVGDLLVAILYGVESDSSIGTPATPTDWTALITKSDESSSDLQVLKVVYKVATAGDVAAGSITASAGVGGSSNIYLGVGCLRITGQGDAASIQSISDYIASDATPEYELNTTPTFAGSLFLFIIGGAGNHASGSAAGYAMATDNPSWTEQWDSYSSGDGYGGAGSIDNLAVLASAVRSQVTATGLLSATLTTFLQSIGILIVIPPLTNASVSPAVISAAAGVQAPSVAAGAVVSPAVVSAANAVQAPVVTTPESDWTNLDKSADPDWENVPKT